MRFPGKIFFFIIVCGATLLSQLGAESLPEADELFKRANDPGNGKVFSALEEVTPGGVKNRVVQQILPDGTKLSRSERVDRDDNSRWMLVNGDGVYMIIGNTAIKTDEVISDPQKEIEKMFDGVDPRLSSETTVELTALGGVECYLATRKFHLSDSDKKAVYNLLPEDIRSRISLEQLVKSLPATIQLYMGKEDSFPYKIAIYNPAGQLISSQSYSEFELDPDLPDGYFEIPAGIKVVVPKSINEMTRAVVDAMRESRAAADSAAKAAAEAPVSVGKGKTILIAVIGVLAAILVITIIIRMIRKNR